MGVLDKIRKRMKYPVTLPNGEVIHIRSADIGERIRANSLEELTKIGFMIGCSLVEDDGSPVFTFKDKETDAEFGMRVSLECGLDPEAMDAIGEALKKLGKSVNQGVIEKNSPETSTPS